MKEENTNNWYNIHHGFNVFNQRDLKNYDVYANYYYQRIPTQILIDFDGKIIGHWVGGSPENSIALDNLLEEKLPIYDGKYIRFIARFFKLIFFCFSRGINPFYRFLLRHFPARAPY